MPAFGSSNYLPLSYAAVEIPKPWWIYYYKEGLCRNAYQIDAKDLKRMEA